MIIYIGNGGRVKAVEVGVFPVCWQPTEQTATGCKPRRGKNRKLKNKEEICTTTACTSKRGRFKASATVDVQSETLRTEQ